MTDDAQRPPPYEVRATGHSLNMAGWTWQKSMYVTEELYEIVKLVRADHRVPRDVAKEIEGRAASAAFNSTKLMSLGTGEEWSVDHGKQAMRDDDGYTHVYRYYHEGADYRARERFERGLVLRRIAKEIEDLFATRSEFRTLLGELLQKYRDEVELARLRELHERASMGKLAWDDFLRAVRPEIGALRSRAESIERPEPPL